MEKNKRRAVDADRSGKDQESNRQPSIGMNSAVIAPSFSFFAACVEATNAHIHAGTEGPEIEITAKLVLAAVRVCACVCACVRSCVCRSCEWYGGILMWLASWIKKRVKW